MSARLINPAPRRLTRGVSEPSTSSSIFVSFMSFMAISAALLLTLSLSACQRQEGATLSDCERLFERLVELELREMGYNDPTLAERWRLTLKGRYQEHIKGCVGRPLAPHALRCAQEATLAEQVSHECLSVSWLH